MQGIGGRTVAEARQRLTYAELLAWATFRAKYGTLHLGRRIDLAIGGAMALYANSISKHGGYKASDFAPYEPEPELDLGQAMKEWY